MTKKNATFGLAWVTRRGQLRAERRWDIRDWYRPTRRSAQAATESARQGTIYTTLLLPPFDSTPRWKRELGQEKS